MRSFLGIVHAVLLGLLGSAAASNNTCRNPKVRHEWRKLSPNERTEWMNAVNVTTLLLQDTYDVDWCLLVHRYSSSRSQTYTVCSGERFADPSGK